MDGWINRMMGTWINGWMDKKNNGYMVEWMDVQSILYLRSLINL